MIPGHKFPESDYVLRSKNVIYWLTGLSGAGKSTIATALCERIRSSDRLAYVLDGDEMRKGLNADLGFSVPDRKENLRRTREVAGILHELGVTVIVSFISPYAEDRALARDRFGSDFVEVFVRCPLHVCEMRDTKGYYARARNGEIADFTGISAHYEPPIRAEVVVDTDTLSVEACVDRIIEAFEVR
jgi:adenylylsulfate kinase